MKIPETYWSRLCKCVIDVYHELLMDLTEERSDVEGHDAEGDQLAVKQ